MEQNVAQTLSAETLDLHKQMMIDLMCGIIVSDINVEVGEEQLKRLFDPFGPLKSVTVDWDLTQKHKGQERLYSSRGS